MSEEVDPFLLLLFQKRGKEILFLFSFLKERKMKKKMLLKPFKDLTLHRSSMRRGKYRRKEEKEKKENFQKMFKKILPIDQEFSIFFVRDPQAQGWAIIFVRGPY